MAMDVGWYMDVLNVLWSWEQKCFAVIAARTHNI